MNQELVVKQIQACSVAELKAWKEHALKCRDCYIKCPNDNEVIEYDLVIAHINQRLRELESRENFTNFGYLLKYQSTSSIVYCTM